MREDGLLDGIHVGRNIPPDPRLLQGQAQRRRLVVDQGFGQDIQGDVEFLVGVQAVDAAAGDIGLSFRRELPSGMPYWPRTTLALAGGFCSGMRLSTSILS